MKELVYLCIDIGGTKTAVACYDLNKLEIFYISFPTLAHNGAVDLVNRAFEAARQFLIEKKIVAAGIASPGPLDSKSGNIIFIPTMHWKNVPIVKLFSEKFGAEFILLNDCNAGALGEYANIKKLFNSLCYISLSTGVGGGIIVNGKLYCGLENAAEFGHIRVSGRGKKCACGLKDCLELYSSGTAIEKYYCKKTGCKFAAKDIAIKARTGDMIAISAFEICSEKLSEALRNICKILDPPLIIFGGGLIAASDLILPKLHTKYPNIKIQISELKGKQVLLGILYSISE